jgi:hypothetical protein
LAKLGLYKKKAIIFPADHYHSAQEMKASDRKGTPRQSFFFSFRPLSRLKNANEKGKSK